MNKKKVILNLAATIILIAAFSIFILLKTKYIHNPISNGSITSNIKTADAKVKNNVKEQVLNFNEIPLTRGDINIPVLCYHDVNPKQSNALLLDPEKFKAQMQYLKDNNYIPITLEELYGFLKENKEIPTKSVVITFDDGYKGNYTYAYPILKDFNFKATIFMISDFADNDLYLSKKELKELSDNGIEIQSHTDIHRDLSKLSKEAQISTMKTSKKNLEAIINKSVDYIAYPFGNSNPSTREAAKEAGYKLGFNLNGKMADKSDNSYNIDRLYISNDYSLQQFINKLTKSPKN
ncbi:polysaccharide deacetylase family protein [Inconstantimicrobium mannanitabidum]|uniref:Deacetylase n=1 Tax=Inconstantimicrobium mannanitabidum TaxID=1604901 RepID=A0ACB5R6Z2_9CLOT|nr:polysaccharide deacetylase family protein [Clostridium sp. TW13]GKX64766.1 deacetylase [Clostridium sp. TW13]